MFDQYSTNKLKSASPDWLRLFCLVTLLKGSIQGPVSAANPQYYGWRITENFLCDSLVLNKDYVSFARDAPHTCA